MIGVPAHLQYKKSLNRDVRKRELMKITRENQVMLKRLQEKKPSYNVTQWAQDDQQRRKLLENICEFPYQLQTEDASQIHPGDMNGEAYL